MLKRKQLSKKMRFEIFKRDSFTCQYCGAHPPDVILHVDHILAVASGGGNEEDNLVTACQSCNLGKSANSLTNVPKSLKDKASEIKEAEGQLRGYHEIIEGRRQRIESEAWEVARSMFDDADDEGVRRDYLRSIKQFLGKLDKYECVEAAEIAADRFAFNSVDYTNTRRFKYFCGICWKRIKGDADG